MHDYVGALLIYVVPNPREVVDWDAGTDLRVWYYENFRMTFLALMRLRVVRQDGDALALKALDLLQELPGVLTN
jgi:hypothetical protein